MKPELIPVDHDPFAEDQQQAVPQEKPPSTAWDMVKAIPRGLAKGAAGIADAVSGGKQQHALNPLFGAPANEYSAGEATPFAPAPEHTQAALEELTGSWGEAKTKPGKYVESVAEQVPTALLGPESLLSKGAVAAGSGILGQFGDDVAGAPGRFAGSLLGGGTAGAATAAKNVRPDFERTMEAFHNLDLIPTAATTGVGGKTAKWAEANVLPQAIGSADRMQKVMENNLSKFTEKQQEIAAQFGGAKSSKHDMGEELQDTILSGWQKRKEEAGTILNAIDQAFGPNDKFVPSNLFKAIHKPTGSASTAEVKAFTDAPELQEIDQLLTKTGGQLTFADMKALKTKFGDMLDPRYAKSVNAAQIGQITKALDDDIGAAVKSLGNKDVVRDWEYAKATYSNAMKDYNQAFKKLLGTKDIPVRAERVYDILMGQAGTKIAADQEAFKTVWGQLGKQKQGDLSATVLAHMGNKYPDKLGSLEGFSLSTFLTNYKNLSPVAKDMLFKQTGNAALEKSFDDLLHAAQKMGVWNELASSSKSGTFAGMAQQASLPMIALLNGQFSKAAMSLLVNFGGANAAATLLTNPTAVRKLAYAMDKVNAGMMGSAKAMLGATMQMQENGIEPEPEFQQ